MNTRGTSGLKPEPNRNSNFALLAVFLGLSVLWVVPGTQAFAQEKNTAPSRPPELRLSLKEAMLAAVDENPTVQLFRERITQAQDQANTQLGALLPNISGTMGGSRRKFFLSSFGGAPSTSNPRDFYEARAFLTQNIFSLSLIQKWRASNMNIDVANLDSETTKRDMMATTGLAYLETLRAQASVVARAADVKLNQELLRLAIERKSAGMATSLDVTRAKVQLENEKQRLLVAQNSYGRSTLNLIRAMGVSFDVNLVLTDELKMTEVGTQSVEEALKVAQEHRVELLAQAKRVRLAALSLSSVTMERVPSLTGFGDVGMIGDQIPNALTTDNVSVLLSIPIFDGGQRESRISENRSLVRQESIKTRDLQYQVTLEVRDALLTLESAKQQVEVAQEGLRLSLQELELARQRFSVGVATNIEVTNAQTSVAQARDNLIEGLFNFNASRVNLARAQGRLDTL